MKIVQRTVAQIPWRMQSGAAAQTGHPGDPPLVRRKVIEQGWSREILELQIRARLYERQGSAVTNFTRTLPPSDSDLATQAFKDPYLFDFLGTAEPRTERELEQRLVDHIQRFLLEMGAGFAFVGRHVLIEVGDSDFRVDLLFYHIKLRRYVVVELQGGAVQPRLRRPDEPVPLRRRRLMRHPDDAPTIGLLLCKGQGPDGRGVRPARPRQAPRVADWRPAWSRSCLTTSREHCRHRRDRGGAQGGGWRGRIRWARLQLKAGSRSRETLLAVRLERRAWRPVHRRGTVRSLRRERPAAMLGVRGSQRSRFGNSQDIHASSANAHDHCP